MITIWINPKFVLLPWFTPSIKASFWTIGLRWLWFEIKFNSFTPGIRAIAFNYDWLFGQENPKFRQFFHCFGPFLLSRTNSLEIYQKMAQETPIPPEWNKSKIPHKRGSKKRVYR